ncbi:MAG: 4Fe-4S binding protein [Proteobacteria bacterium]|nr:4Fe-4S binding protein [Pseudomonadota bacterium]
MGMIRALQGRFDDYYRKHWALSSDNWEYFTAKVFPFVVKECFSRFNHPFFGPFLRRLFRFTGKNHHAEACIVPIYKDLSFKANRENSFLPIQKIRESIEESSFRVIMKRCICRDSFKCKKFPRDFACIMLGEACHTMVDNGIARPATVRECLDHLDRASGYGLVGICAWTEMESIAKGIPAENKLKYFEICFCCPCCCNGLVSFKKWHEIPELRKLFKSTGWRPRVTEKCTACKACEKVCPMEAIAVLKDNSVTIDNSCIGCGLCSIHCRAGAIVMEEFEPMKDHILDYFRDIRPQING